MQQLEHFIGGRWQKGEGEGKIIYHAITGEPIYRAGGDGIDLGSALEYGRQTGGPVLRHMTFHERGLMLKKLASYLYTLKEKYYPISYQTGATRADSWYDIEGGIGNLFSNASLRRQFPDQPFYTEGEAVPSSKGGTFIGHHIMVPREGIAIHINAYNFPIWGMLEKIAVNLLAGMPAIVKPATATAYLTEAMVRDIVKSGILPDGALQLVAGAGRGLLDQVMYQDVITFTGSASTGLQLKAHPQVIREAIPFNLEADSLNGTILGEDAVPGTPEFDLFIKEVRKEMTIKCGQRCTAIRRILIPENLTEAVQVALTTALQQTTIGDPMREGVRMGALISMDQVAEVRERVVQLTQSASIVYGNPLEVNVLDADPSKGAFMSPILLRADDPLNKVSVHEVEAFGPVSSLIPYRNLDEALLLVRMGKGSLVASMTTYDDTLARRFVMGAAAHHGRILVLNRDCAKESTGHGSPLPTLVHGGPGRAGGGEEMGGKRGVLHYLHRTAIQGSPTTITRITEVFQRGSKVKHDEIHPFRRYFEELQIGEQWITAKHTVTETDIVNFANVSGDHFYAHVDETSLEGTLFERRVAHGYYLLAKAAGLFVDPRKGPVLLNYGIDECRFTKPVYPGNTIGVKITVKEKIAQEKKDETDVAKGIVKWDVEVYDEANEPVALAVVLTMVKKRNQD